MAFQTGVTFSFVKHKMYFQKYLHVFIPTIEVSGLQYCLVSNILCSEEEI